MRSKIKTAIAQHKHRYQKTKHKAISKNEALQNVIFKKQKNTHS